MKPKKIKKVHHRVLLISLIGLFITMYVVIFQNKYAKTDDQSPSTQIETNPNEYTSSFLGFKFLVPVKLQPNESGNTIKLSNDESVISITRLFSYFDSEKEYMDYISELNNYKYSIRETDNNGFYIVIINLESETNPNETSYIKNIDTDTFVSISTSSPELYDELEQIAASFEYLGDTK